MLSPDRKTLLPLPPSLLLPLSAVKISLPMPECHMWSTLMRCIFNPTDLHFQNFPLPVLPRNGAQIERVCSLGCPLCLGVCFDFFVCLYSGLSLCFSIWKIEAVALDCWYLRFTNSHFLDEFVKKKKKMKKRQEVQTRPRPSSVNTLDIWRSAAQSWRKWPHCFTCEEGNSGKWSCWNVL